LLPKPLVISIAGKGGTGKTSLTALMLKTVIEQRAFEEILVVDADPASNIPDILGVESTTTVGAILDSRKATLDAGSRRENKLLRDKVLEAIGHGNGFDYLIMGHTRGQGCYCLLNDTLSRILTEDVKLYDLVLIDFEPGLEHFSRQPDKKSDILLVTTDPSRMGFETGKRIRELTEELGSNYRQRFLIGCRFAPEMERYFFAYMSNTGLTPLGIVPYDNQLMTLSLTGQNIFQLDCNSSSYRAVVSLWERFITKLGFVPSLYDFSSLTY
jgi:CO dehydrogenase maturation factor